MYICYLCAVEFGSTQQLRVHLQRHKFNGQLTFPIKCCQGGCSSVFTTVFNYVRHLKSYHSMCGKSVAVHDKTVDTEQASEDVHFLDTSVDDSSDRIDSTHCLQSVEKHTVSLIAQLRANSSIPYCIIPTIVQSFNDMACSLRSVAQSEISSGLLHAGIDKVVADDVAAEVTGKIEHCCKPLDSLSSRYKIDKYFEGHPFSVMPESVCFGPHVECHSGASRYAYDTFQYVSVEKTLHSLLSNKLYVDALLRSKCEPGIIADFMDGTRCQQHYMFGDCTKFSLKLQLFYDGLGVTNPLRSHGVIHNVGVFYYTVNNLPQHFNSCFGNVHLLALCYSHDLAVYGYDAVLDKFVSEMKHLSSVGISGEFPLLGNSTVYANLSQVSCDNLALNSLFGFIESFSGSYFCTLCYASSDEIQHKFREEQFCKRTITEYNEDVSNVPKMLKQGKVHCRGVKRYCKLNDLEGFHVTDNWSLDIMHVVLEGIIPVELSCILHSLCMDDKCISLDVVNKEILMLWGKITVEQTHKPAELSKLLLPGQGLTPSMKAVQYFAFLKYLPLAVGKYVPENNAHWQFLLHLAHLVDLIFARHFTRDMVLHLKDVIDDHLSNFLELYSSYGVKLKPKHHLLVHLPSVILKNGPLVGMSCMKYELKNSFFKRCAHIVCNFTNICKTLAHRHQQQSLYIQLSNGHIRDTVTVGKTRFDFVGALPYSVTINNKLGLCDSAEVAVCTKLCVGTVEYKVGHYVVLQFDHEAGLPIFAKIVSFVSAIDSDLWYIVVEVVKTVLFVSHFHAYKVLGNKSPCFDCVQYSQLLDHQPLYCHSLWVYESKLHFLRLPYHILKLLFRYISSACHLKMTGDREIDRLTQGRRSMVIDYYWTVSNVL